MRANRNVVVWARRVPSTSTNATEGGSGKLGQSEKDIAMLLPTAQPLTDSTGEFTGLGRLGGLRDDANDRLGVADPHMHPSIVPGQAKAIAKVDTRVRKVRRDPFLKMR